MSAAFLRIPPFPGSRAPALADPDREPRVNRPDPAEIADLLRRERVGGCFWGHQAELPPGRDLLLIPTTAAQARAMVAAASRDGLMHRCAIVGDWPIHSTSWIPVIAPGFDPWHMADAAEEIWVDGDDEHRLIAAITGHASRAFGEATVQGSDVDRMIDSLIGRRAYRCPFSGNSISVRQAIELLADWRQKIDRNRALSAIYGIATWKRATVDALLWDGTDPVRHAARLDTRHPPGDVLAWKAKTAPALLNRLEASGSRLMEVEDGFIRGRGLGANCVPPLSIVVDGAGIYFDPAGPSDLETLLQTEDIGPELVDRAAALRRQIVNAGISKYEMAERCTRPVDGMSKLLVAGQVEDDRSMLSGGNGQTNFELLQRTREAAPDAWIVYRPHPDVEAGHRKGHVPETDILRFANQIDHGSAIGTLIDAVDEVHCITSLAGFEALLRNKRVIVHGAPFYAGWGLTVDIGPIPARRTRRRSLDELVAATLILYPRYLDPVTRLPCPPEVLVDRISRCEDDVAAPLAGIRALQGKMKRALRRMREMAA